jgi:hypothetical protein
VRIEGEHCISIGTWKQYSGRKSLEKNPENFLPEYCFHKITGTGRFLAGLFDLGCIIVVWMKVCLKTNVIVEKCKELTLSL